MSTERRLSIMKQLFMTYPNVSAGAETIAMYLRLTGDIPEDALQVAIDQCISSCKFLPTIAEIRETWLTATLPACATAPGRVSAKSCTPMLSPGANAAKRQHRFSNSRTLPGQACACRRSNAALLNCLTGSCRRCAACARKRAASSGISSLRSRRGGSGSRTTFKRCSKSARNRPASTKASSG